MELSQDALEILKAIDKENKATRKMLLAGTKFTYRLITHHAGLLEAAGYIRRVLNGHLITYKLTETGKQCLESTSKIVKVLN